MEVPTREGVTGEWGFQELEAYEREGEGGILERVY